MRPSYSWMRTNVGLAIAAGSTPSASATARVRRVFPAPSGPIRPITTPGPTTSAKARPRRSVSASVTISTIKPSAVGSAFMAIVDARVGQDLAHDLRRPGTQGGAVTAEVGQALVPHLVGGDLPQAGERRVDGMPLVARVDPGHPEDGISEG